MKKAIAEKADTSVRSITRPAPGPVFVVLDRAKLIIRAGAAIVVDGESIAFATDTEVVLRDLQPGVDFVVAWGEDDALYSVPATPENLVDASTWGGFHYAPGGNATARGGGDDVPAINPFSIWDIGYRPKCADPRGMTCVDRRFWCDIYLLGTAPFDDGSSKFGATIADGRTPPTKQKSGRYAKLDQPTAIEIYAALGKSLLSPEEFFAAAFGVTEGTSCGDDPQTTRLDAPRTSKWGVMQATGNMSTWGTDGDPDGQRQAWRFGGHWGGDGFAGSRGAFVDYWPDHSYEWIGARGRGDHLHLDA